MYTCIKAHRNLVHSQSAVSGNSRSKKDVSTKQTSTVAICRTVRRKPQILSSLRSVLLLRSGALSRPWDLRGQ